MFTNTKRAIFAAVAATAAVAALAACDPQSSASSAPNSPDLASFAMPTSKLAVPTTTEAPAVDPMRSNGTWSVPSEIRPGTYRATPNGSDGTGYYEVCADYTCEIGTPGFLKNDFLNGPGFLVIPSNAISVKLDDLTLTPINN